MPIKNALSIDLEDWYHPEFVRKRILFNPKSQIIDSTTKIIKLLKKYNIKATFFVLGEIAKKKPQLIKTIYHNGHEIASHGMSHIPLWHLNYHEFNKELIVFKEIIKNILGKNINIYGFRAPTFSINNRTKYALKTLIKNEYLYDSSIVPTKFFYYGLNKAPRSIYRPNLDNPSLNDNNSKIIEFPLTVIDFGKISIPISGGFYLRVFPYFIYKFLLKRINKKKKPFIIYFHPWETYINTFRVKDIGIIKYFVTYYRIKNALKKIEKLIQDFKFGTVKDVIKQNL